MTLFELPGNKQTTLGSFDPFTCCSDSCSPSQPASANICLSAASRCLLSPPYRCRRASTTSRETGLYWILSAMALGQQRKVNARTARVLNFECAATLAMDITVRLLLLRHQFFCAAQFRPGGIRAVADFQQEGVVLGGVGLLAGGFGGAGCAVEAVEAVGMQLQIRLIFR